MGSKRGLAVGRAAGRPENVGDVLRGVGRKKCVAGKPGRYSNATASLVKRPKLFVRDAGLAAFLCGIHSTEDLRSSPLAGALWETLVCAEMRRLQLNRSGGWQMNFWRDRSREADFLIHRGGRFHLADAKWTAAPRPRDAAALNKVAAMLPPNSVASRSIFCRTPNAYPLNGEVTAIPLEDLPDTLPV